MSITFNSAGGFLNGTISSSGNNIFIQTSGSAGIVHLDGDKVLLQSQSGDTKVTASLKIEDNNLVINENLKVKRNEFRFKSADRTKEVKIDVSDNGNIRFKDNDDKEIVKFREGGRIEVGQNDTATSQSVTNWNGAISASGFVKCKNTFLGHNFGFPDNFILAHSDRVQSEDLSLNAARGFAFGQNPAGHTFINAGDGNNAGYESINFYQAGLPSSILGKNRNWQFGAPASVQFEPPEKLTVEGNISASGTIFADRLEVTQITSSIVTSSILQTEGSNIFGDTISDTHTFNGRISTTSHITASGNISSSGLITVNNKLQFGADGEIRTVNAAASSGDLKIIPDGDLQLGYSRTDNILIGRPDNTGASTKIYGGVSTEAIKLINNQMIVNSNITASGDISASGALKGGSLDINGTSNISDTATFTGQILSYRTAFPQLQLSDDSGTDVMNLGHSNNIFYFKTSDNSNDIRFRRQDNFDVIEIDMSAEMTHISGGLNVRGLKGHITASGNISGSSTSTIQVGGNITTAATGSFGEINLEDDKRIKLGTGDDLQIYHNGDNSVISDLGAGDLLINGANVRIRDANDGNTIALFTQGAGVELRHDNTVRFETSDGGINVTGHITASGNISASGTSHTLGGLVTIRASADNQDLFKIQDVDNENNLSFKVDSNQHGDFHLDRNSADKIRINTYWPAQIDNDSYETFGGLILGSDADRGDKTGFGLYVSAGPDSGSIYTKERVFIGVGGATGSNDMLSVGGNITTTSHITASGNISVSGTGSFTGGGIFSDRVGIGTDTPLSDLHVDEGDIRIDTADNGTQALRFSDRGSTKAQIQYKDNGETLNILTGGSTNAIEITNTQGVTFSSHITASGNISSSGTITMLTASIGGGIFTSASLAAGGGGSGAVSAVANGSNNRVATFSSGDALNGEANLTFDGSTLSVTGNQTISTHITASGHISASGTGNHHFGGTLRPDKIIVDDITINNSTISDTQDLTINPARDLYIDVTENGEIYFQHDGGDTVFQFNLDSTPELDVTGNFKLDGTGTIELESIGNTTIDASGDIILSADGDQITMDDGTTTRFTFNVDGTPELDVTGDFIIDGSGDIKLDSATNVVDLIGNVTASGDISSSGVGTFNSLDIAGAIDVDGLTNLDIVDIDGAATFQSRTVFEIGTFTDGDTSPDVRTSTIFKTANTGATTITEFDNGTEGQIIHVLIQDTNTDFTHNASKLILFRGLDATSLTTNDIISFVCFNGTIWMELNRQDNS